MSTRANIILIDGRDELIFYRHSDGYPSATLPTLNKFLDLIRAGAIRDELSQAAGWLVLIGADEYRVSYIDDVIRHEKHGSSMTWKCGSYEPTTEIHADVEYVYLVDLKLRDVHYRNVPQLRPPTPPCVIASRLRNRPGGDRNGENGSRGDG